MAFLLVSQCKTLEMAPNMQSLVPARHSFKKRGKGKAGTKAGRNQTILEAKFLLVSLVRDSLEQGYVPSSCGTVDTVNKFTYSVFTKMVTEQIDCAVQKTCGFVSTLESSTWLECEWHAPSHWWSPTPTGNHTHLPHSRQPWWHSENVHWTMWQETICY